jgi:prepilin-type N-terminal cleavage/methylation domain-containing protein
MKGNVGMKTQSSTKAGFTLLEIMIVVGIIGVITPIAIPNFIRARSQSQTKACINNLRQIDSAKQQWAMETSSSGAAVPGGAELQPYIGRNSVGLRDVLCPQDTAGSFDTSYVVGSLNTLPACSIQPATHTLAVP